MELIRYKVKDDTVMGVLIDYNWGLGVYYTIEKLSKMIPPGAYSIQLTYSPKFKTELPLIWGNDVHKNRGIRIHVGNTVRDTNGCILIGNGSDLGLLRINHSFAAVTQLTNAMDKSVVYSLFVRNEI